MGWSTELPIPLIAEWAAQPNCQSVLLVNGLVNQTANPSDCRMGCPTELPIRIIGEWIDQPNCQSL